MADARVTFDRDSDALYVQSRPSAPASVARTIAHTDTLLVDYDAAGDVVGVEFLGVSVLGAPLDGLPRAAAVGAALRAWAARWRDPSA